MKSPNCIEPELITTAEAAERLGKSTRAVLKLCSNHTLRSRRFGARTILIEADSLALAKHIKRGRPKGANTIHGLRFANRLRSMGKRALADEVERVCLSAQGVSANLSEDTPR